jgi:hypothetical protein
VFAPQTSRAHKIHWVRVFESCRAHPSGTCFKRLETNTLLSHQCVPFPIVCCADSCPSQPMEDEEEEDVIQVTFTALIHVRVLFPTVTLGDCGSQVKWGRGDPLIRYKNLAEPPEPEDFSMEDVNMKGDSDLLLRVGPSSEELVSIRLHKDILAAHSAVVAGMLSNQQYERVLVWLCVWEEVLGQDGSRVWCCEPQRDRDSRGSCRLCGARHESDLRR